MLEVFGKIARSMNTNGRDAKIFVVSLLLAFAIWLTHNLSLNYSELLRIPVTAQCDITGHSGVSASPSTIMVRCRASGFNLISLRNAEKRNPVIVTFKIEDMHRLSEETYYVTSSDLERYTSQILGNGTKLELFVSDTVLFRFPIVNHKKVPVQPVYSISFKPQYINIGGLRMNPDSVTVYGEPSHLNTIDRIFTEPLSLENLSASIHGEAKLDKIQGIRISDETINYSMEVSRYVEIKRLIPVSSLNVPKGKSLIIYPANAEISFKCAFPVSTDPSDKAKVCVDYEDFEQSLKGQCLAKIYNLPSGVIDYNINPAVFDCVESGK